MGFFLQFYKEKLYVFLVFLVTCVAYISLFNHVKGREVQMMKRRSFLPVYMKLLRIL